MWTPNTEHEFIYFCSKWRQSEQKSPHFYAFWVVVAVALTRFLSFRLFGDILSSFCTKTVRARTPGHDESTINRSNRIENKEEEAEATHVVHFYLIACRCRCVPNRTQNTHREKWHKKTSEIASYRFICFVIGRWVDWNCGCIGPDRLAGSNHPTRWLLWIAWNCVWTLKRFPFVNRSEHASDRRLGKSIDDAHKYLINQNNMLMRPNIYDTFAAQRNSLRRSPAEQSVWCVNQIAFHAAQDRTLIVCLAVAHISYDLHRKWYFMALRAETSVPPMVALATCRM